MRKIAFALILTGMLAALSGCSYILVEDPKPTVIGAAPALYFC